MPALHLWCHARSAGRAADAVNSIRRWAQRATLAIGGYAIIVLGARLGGTDVDLAPLAAIVFAGCAVWWLTSDSVGAASSTRWDEPDEFESRYVRSDPAANYLQRLCADVTMTSTRRASPTAAQSLQGTVRQLVAARLEQRPLRGLPALDTLPAELSDYLNTNPAPRLQPRQLDRIVTSIEEI